MGTPFAVCTLLGDDVGVAEDTAPPASPYHPAPFRTVAASNPPAWVKPMFGALLIAEVITNSVAFCDAPCPVTLSPAWNCLEVVLGVPSKLRPPA